MVWFLYTGGKLELNEKISCVMVTAGRPHLIERSLDCYIRQTYPHKELVVLTQGSPETNAVIRSIIQRKNRPDIKLHEAPQSLSLGGMRNLSIELTHGSVICQWDDDDLSHSSRLWRQYRSLRGDDTIATAYQEHLKWFEDTDEIYWVDWSIETEEDRRYLHGTAMFRKKAFTDCHNLLYPEYGNQSQKEEDWNAIQKLLKHGKMKGIREGCQYIYTFHGNNIYWRDHHALVLQKRVYTSEEVLLRRDFITEHLRDCGVNRPVKICAISGPVFEYQPCTI
jgi:glycosyltransferase involved in cell wall biosynthesis